MIDYKFYTETYHGCSIPEAELSHYASRATDQLAYYKRIYTVTAREIASTEAGNVVVHSDALVCAASDGSGNVAMYTPDPFKMAICAIAEVMYAIAATQNGGGAVASASIGSVSVSYGNAASIDLSPKGQAKEMYAAARRYLDIYRG